MCFIDLEGRVSFAYVPVRDQNLVVRGLKLTFDLFLCFLLILKMVFKMKSQVANENWFVFFDTGFL